MTALRVTAVVLGWGLGFLSAQEPVVAKAELIGRVDLPASGHETYRPSVAVWLDALDNIAMQPARPGRFTVQQKNKMFSPHLLVIPMGSVVSFPNADPFFHNVFSLFNGKRFDLGLYEAGTSKEVLFSREGVSYIFCNIHPEMSAVIISLRTQFNAIADSSGRFVIHEVPPGEYELRVWIEGTPQPILERLSSRVHIRSGTTSDITVDASGVPPRTDKHLNKFGRPYEQDSKPTY